MSAPTDTGAKLATNGLDGAPSEAPEQGALPKRPERGERIELQIDSLAHGGEGVGRLGDTPSGAHGGGYVVFVSGAVPGDRVRAEVVKRKRSYAHARLVEILDPSPERIAPAAKHPGVPWQVLAYERQLQIKHEQVEDALRRIGKLDGFELQEIVPALQQWRYRNKLEYSFGESTAESSAVDVCVVRGGESPAGNPSGDDGGAGGRTAAGELVCGFHAPSGWNMVEPMDDCLLASERGNRAREAALRWCREQGLLAWSRGGRPGGGRAREEEREQQADAPAQGNARRSREQRTGPAPDGRPFLRNLVVREGRHSGKLQVRLVSTDGELEAGALAAALVAELGEETLSGVLWTRSSSLAETTAGGETELVWGEAELPERLGELDLRISSEAFFQTNTEMAEVLYGIVVDYAALEGWERVYDLYCGIGTIALTLAPRAGELWGVEIVEQAVADAIAGAKRNEVRSARFFAGDARLALPELIERAGKPDVVVVDPPRAGLSQKVVRRIVDASPKRIVYVSCNPTTLAPNAAQLVEAGWRLVKVRPVDMFPQTPHIECVALLERG